MYPFEYGTFQYLSSESVIETHSWRSEKTNYLIKQQVIDHSGEIFRCYIEILFMHQYEIELIWPADFYALERTSWGSEHGSFDFLGGYRVGFRGLDAPVYGIDKILKLVISPTVTGLT